MQQSSYKKHTRVEFLKALHLILSCKHQHLGLKLNAEELTFKVPKLASTLSTQRFLSLSMAHKKVYFVQQTSNLSCSQRSRLVLALEFIV
jgi:hypothetical protein